MAKGDVKICIYCGIEKSLNDFYIYDEKYKTHNLKCVQCTSDLNRLKRYDVFCKKCGLPSTINQNGVCKRCNYADGLCECRVCKKLLPLAYSFDGKHRQCKVCMAQKRRERRKGSL